MSVAPSARSRPLPPLPLLRSKRKASAGDDGREQRDDGASPGPAARKHPRLPPLHLPQRAAFVPSSSTALAPGQSPFAPSPSATSPFDVPQFAYHPQQQQQQPPQPSAYYAAGGMDVDESASSSEESELRTPSYPDNLAHYPFGVHTPPSAGPLGEGRMQVDDGAVAAGLQVKFVGLMGPQDYGTGVHGPHCTSIPRIVLAPALPDGTRTLWSVCRDCGSTSPAAA